MCVEYCGKFFSTKIQSIHIRSIILVKTYLLYMKSKIIKLTDFLPISNDVYILVNNSKNVKMLYNVYTAICGVSGLKTPNQMKE